MAGRLLCRRLLRGLAGMVEELIDGGLEIVEVDLLLGEPFLQSGEGRIVEKFGEAGELLVRLARGRGGGGDVIIFGAWFWGMGPSGGGGNRGLWDRNDG